MENKDRDPVKGGIVAKKPEGAKVPAAPLAAKPAAPAPVPQAPATPTVVTEVLAKAAAPAKPVVPVKAPAPVKSAAAPSLPTAPKAPAKPVAPVKKVIKAVASPAPTVEPKPAMPATLAATVEGLHEMATVAPQPTQVTEKAQAMLGDMNDRFKTAFEKSSKLGEEMVELGKGNVEALVASARIAAKAGETMGQEAAEYGKKSFEQAMAVFKSFASVKSPTELFQLQSDYAKSSFDSAVAEASKLSESLMKVAGEVAQPLSTRYAVVAEKIKAATL